jgi:hypothetical protein
MRSEMRNLTRPLLDGADGRLSALAQEFAREQLARKGHAYNAKLN